MEVNYYILDKTAISLLYWSVVQFAWGCLGLEVKRALSSNHRFLLVIMVVQYQNRFYSSWEKCCLICLRTFGFRSEIHVCAKSDYKFLLKRLSHVLSPHIYCTVYFNSQKWFKYSWVKCCSIILRIFGAEMKRVLSMCILKSQTYVKVL